MGMVEMDWIGCSNAAIKIRIKNNVEKEKQILSLT
jgi:hypothetical protein